MFALITLLLILGGSPIASSKDSIHLINIENMKFNPNEINAKVGDSLIWKNKDLVTHSVTSNNKSFDSKAILPNQSWTMKIKKKGILNYKCIFHPIMKGKITAE